MPKAIVDVAAVTGMSHFAKATSRVDLQNHKQ